MGSAEALAQVVSIVNENVQEKKEQVIVCSAMSQVTNQLLAISELAAAGQQSAALEIYEGLKDSHFAVATHFDVADEFEALAGELLKRLENFIMGVSMIHELSDRSLAYLSSYGERLSTRLLTCVLVKHGLKARQFDSNFIKTKGFDFLEDDIDWEATRKAAKEPLKMALSVNEIPVVTGFFGTNDDVVCLLGRGGSDYSASVLSTVLGSKVVEIWTDVDGFMSADPRLVSSAQVLPEIGFKEASELCFFGAKVLHPRTILPVIKGGGDVWIKNTFNADARGTRITKHAPALEQTVLSISSKKVGLLSLDLFGAEGNKSRSEVFYELFAAIKGAKVAVDAIAASEAMISFCVEEKHLENQSLIDKIAAIAPLDVRQGRSILCIVSPEKVVYNHHGVLAQIFEAIAEAGTSVEMDSQNASEVGQLVVIKNEDVPATIKAIHKSLITKK